MRSTLVHAFSLALTTCIGCGDVTNSAAEELRDPGPRDVGFDAALSFDGVNDYASAGTARMPQIERPQSLMLWVKSESSRAANGEHEVLLALRRSDYSGLVVALDAGVPLVYNVWGPRELARGAAALPPSTWHHLAYVHDSVASTLYVNGVDANPGMPGSLPGTNRTPITAFIGSLDGYSHMFHGSLDELRVYDRALSAKEIAVAAAGRRPDDVEPLVLYLPFDEAGGERCYDRSGLDNHAQLGDGVAELMPARIPRD